MSLHTTATILSALITFSRLFSQASAYAIDQSCVPYVGDGQDKTIMITDAMTAANQMLTHAASVVTGGQGNDNARYVHFGFTPCSGSTRVFLSSPNCSTTWAKSQLSVSFLGFLSQKRATLTPTFWSIYCLLGAT